MLEEGVCDSTEVSLLESLNKDTPKSIKTIIGIIYMRVGIWYLEYDLALQLGGSGKLFSCLLHWFAQQFVSKHFPKNASHLTLLLDGTVLLDGQDHRKPERSSVTFEVHKYRMRMRIGGSLNELKYEIGSENSSSVNLWCGFLL